MNASYLAHRYYFHSYKWISVEIFLSWISYFNLVQSTSSIIAFLKCFRQNDEHTVNTFSYFGSFLKSILRSRFWYRFICFVTFADTKKYINSKLFNIVVPNFNIFFELLFWNDFKATFAKFSRSWSIF